MSTIRVDLGKLRPSRKMPDGRVVFDAHITRSGVFEYQNPDGSTRRELRPSAEVFARESLDSFAAMAVTQQHPPEMIRPDNAKRYMVGATGDAIVRDDDHVRATVMVADAATLALMERYPEVSVGYTCDIVEKPGVDPVHGKYDAIQTNIRGNHLAVAVPVARAGASARVRMDGADVPVMVAARAPLYDSPAVKSVSTTTPGDSMPPEQKPDTMNALAQQLAAAEARAAAAELKLAEASSRADAAEGRVDGLQKDIAGLRSERTDADKIAEKDAEIAKQTKRADAAERVLADVPPRIKAGVASRVRLEREAAPIMLGKQGEEFKMDSLDDREIMVAVVERVHGVSIERERSDDYARARFDAAVESWKAGTAVLARLSDVTRPVAARADAAPAESKNNPIDAWKQPLPSSKLK